MRKNIRVTVPVSSPDQMLGLADAITEKHESYSAPPPSGAEPAASAAPAEESPLHHLPMAKFKEDTALARNLLKSSRAKNKESQTLFEKAYVVIGISEGQTSYTEGTLYFMYEQVRSILLGVYKTTPEQLEKFGFNVVVSSVKGKRTVRVDIPSSKSDEMLKLGKAILARHRRMGDSSPLMNQQGLNMDEFARMLGEADLTLTNARALEGESESEMEQSQTIIGIAKKQKVHTKGTLRNIIDRAKKILLSHYSGEEEKLELWGFTVVITETTPSRNTKRIEVIIPKGATITIPNVANGKKAKNTGDTTLSLRDNESDEFQPLEPGDERLMNLPSGKLVVFNHHTKKSGRIKLDVMK